jgi:phospholipase C
MRHAALGLSLLALLSAACSSTSNGGAPTNGDAATGGDGAADALGDDGSSDGAGSMVPPSWNRPVTPPADDAAASQRAACGYKAGALPAETLGKSQPTGTSIPIDTVVVVMMENRSFDHYFQHLKMNGWTDVETAPETFSNTRADGSSVTIHRDTQMCIVDTNHEWAAVHQQYDDGKMDGFLTTNDDGGGSPLPPGGTPDLLKGDRAMVYYEKSDIPFMYSVADQFAIADHYHCSLLGPTWPNRMYLYGATSWGRTDNVTPNNVTNSIFDELTLRGTSWKVYTTTSPGFAVIGVDQVLKYQDHIGSHDDYLADAAAGMLPQVAFVDPGIGDEKWNQNDEHPPAIMTYGQQWLFDTATALMKGPQWSRSALFITYDEHGGFYDHVAPPAACPPDGNEPADDSGKVLPGVHFDRLGIRVPFAVISPYAKKHYVGHHTYDHTSILRFIEARFTLPAMTNRDANAEAPFDLFDFSAARTDSPALVAPPAVDPTVSARCKTTYGG